MTGTNGRTPRLATTVVLAAMAERTGVCLRFDGPCPGGEVGAAYVRWPDGRRSVLTLGSAGAAPLVELARSAGVPAPRYLLVVELGERTAVVQELASGTPPSAVDRPLLDELLTVNRRLAGLLTDRSDLPPLPLYLTTSGPGFCRHEPLARYDRRAARLLDWVRDVGTERNTADGSDLVHVDFHPGNVLVRDGQVSGVIDWDGAGRGDGRLDLVTLRFDLALRAPELGRWLEDLLRETVPLDRLRAYWAHMGLRLVDWAIRHHGPADVARWLETAEPAMSW